jgi:murein DD-endopeptidase MepM/ murein hydrolase activator NlpD
MSEDLKKEQSISEKLGSTYRMVILDDESLREVRSVRLSLSNLYLILCTILLILSLIIGSLVAFTPLKRYIPGYADVRGSRDFMALESQVSDLETLVEEQTVYIDGMKTMIKGGDLPEKVENSVTLIEEAATTAPLNTTENKAVTTATATKPMSRGIGGVYLAAPLKGEISSGFLAENRNDHLGVDIIAPKNSPITAVKEGIVVSAGWNLETGHSITVQHDKNLLSIYKHNQKLLKKTGDRVKLGESIAIIGNSGELSSGPHLHFELWYDGNPIDPAQYIEF